MSEEAREEVTKHWNPSKRKKKHKRKDEEENKWKKDGWLICSIRVDWELIFVPDSVPVPAMNPFHVVYKGEKY